MGTVIFLIILGLIIAAWVMYGNWLEKGMSPRSFDTKLDVHQVRSIFEEKVARSGWKVIDDGNPLVAQSSLMTGIRQQISCRTESQDDGTTRVLIAPERWVTKYGVPKKAHTIRLRMNSFVAGIQAADGPVAVQQHPLKS